MKKAYIIAVIGAGGKTTCIERMAEALKGQGKKVAVMTTTRMWLPHQYSAVGKSWEEAAEILEAEGIVYFGIYTEMKKKMTFPSQASYEALCKKADIVLVEADGAKEKPMKLPDWSREPVIPANTDSIFLLFGLSALGKPLGEVCHRWELGGRAEDRIDEEMALRLLEKGYLQPLRFQFPHMLLTVLLNQADTQKKEAAGKRIKEELEKRGVCCKVVQLRPVRIAVIYMASGFGTRFGRNKLLQEVGGKALYRHGLDQFLDWKEESARRLAEKNEGEGCSTISVEIVLVSQYNKILEDYGEKGVICVENSQAAEGITASIRLGLEAAGEADAYLFSVADQPWLKKSTIEQFVWKFLEAPSTCTMACLCAEGKRRNPVIFHKKHRKELLELKGDKGGSQVMKRYPEAVFEIEAEEKELRDIDQISDILPYFFDEQADIFK